MSIGKVEKVRDTNNIYPQTIVNRNENVTELRYYSTGKRLIELWGRALFPRLNWSLGISIYPTFLT